jgi:hypothetical protein
MEEVGRAILDRERRVLFGVHIFRGLFEAIGLPVVQEWVAAHGVKQIRWLARHLASPYLDQAGQAVIPPLTAWFLEACEGDDRAFREFCAGRHDFEFRSGPPESRDALERRLQPFREHSLPRVREWVSYELSHRDWEAEPHARYEDEVERT